MPDFITTGRIKSMNQQQYTPSQTKTDRIASMLGPVNTTVTTSTGQQYTLDDKQVGWIQNRYKSKMADTYGYDDADQLAKRNGQLSAAALKTYKNTNVDRQLAELGLPSEKELGKYLEDYSRWHTGGMDQVFGQMNLPKDYWTKTKGFYQADMQKAYENTAEDQQRKARGLMPKKWEDEYTDTEIDDQLRARGLPPISKFKTYAERWDNYQGIENFYANVARNETNLRLAGIKDDDTVYPYNGEEYKGKDLYAMAFYDELDKVNDDGSFVYGSIRPLFKNSSTKETTPTGDYLYDRGAAVLADNKNAVSADDYASYNAFSYDDYKSKYPELYERYFANQQTTSGQTVSERLAVQKREEDAEATKEYYTVGKEPGAAETFAHQYAADYPDATPEQMFLDMNQHNVPDTEAYKVYETMKKEAAGTGKWYDIVNAWTKTYGGVWSNVNNSDAPIPDVAKPLTDEQRDAQVEKDLVKAAQQYGQALVTGDNDALYYASERVKTLGFNNQEDLVESLKAGKSDQFVQAVKDAITVYESAVAAYEDTAGPGAPSEASREPINKADEALRALGFKSIHDAIRYVGGEKEAMSPAKWVAQEGEKADSYVQSKKDAYANDADTINDTANTIQSTVARLIDKNDELGKQLDVDTLLSVIDSISDKSSTNPTAMRLALTDLGFLGDELSGWAGDITEGWSDADKRKLNYYLGGNNFTSMAAGEGGANNDWSAVGSARYSQQLVPEDFSLYLEYALQQVNAGNMTEADAYNLLAAKGYQEEMDAYMPEEWHKAHFIENTAPGLWDQSREEDRLLWEDMTPEEQRAASETLWNDLTPEQKSAMYEKGWWKFDPSVYRTFGQALEQQFQAVLPGLGAEIISTPVKVLDAIEAGISGRPDMWETTQDLMEFQQRMGQLGAVTDNVNGAQVAQTAADVVQEIGRMYYYGSIGGAIGGAFAGTSAGAAVMSGAASNSTVVRGASKMFMSMVKSSPFMVSAFANNYSEVKALGASNSEATWFGLITGLSEGILEGFEFDELWGKALGQKNFAELLTTGKHTYLERLGIIGKSWISSMAVSGLGEFTEESIGYVLETFLKMRHSDTWGKGTEWSTEDWLQQAMMGFITGALGGGIAAGSSWVADGVKLANAMKNNPQLQAELPDVLASIGIAKSVPDSAMATYREGGATIMSKESYDGALTALKSCTDAAQNNINEYKKVVAAEDLKLENRLRELDGYAAKVQSIDTSTGKGAKELANLVSSKLGVKLDMGQPLAPQVKAAFKASVDSAVRAHDTAVSDIRASTETALQNSELELQGLQKKFQEHYVGLYLQNEGLLNSLSKDMLTNLAQAYQNGAKYEPAGQASAEPEAVITDQTQATAEATTAEATPAAKTNARVAAREMAYNRVYKDTDAGKAYANEGDIENESGETITPLGLVGKELNDFKAKTTVKIGNVTIELSEFSPTKKMTSKEIIEAAKQSMTEEAAKKLDALISLGKALDVPMVVRDVVAGLSGYAYDGKIYVTLNGSHSVLRTVSHELTHWMRNTSNYSALRNHLVNDVGGKEAFDKMVDGKAKEYGIDLQTDDGRSRADDEVCAELCEKMLENEESLEKFVSKDLSAAKSLRSRLGKILKAVRSVISSLGSADYETRGDLIKQQETIETWYNNLSEAIDELTSAKKTKPRAAESVSNTENANVSENDGYHPYDGVPEYNEPVFVESDEQYEAPPLDLNGMPPEDYYGAVFNPLLDRNVTTDGLNGYVPKANPLTGVTVEDDAEYMRAALSGDRATTSRMTTELMLRNGGKPVLHGTDARVGSWTKIDWDRFASHQMFVSPEEAVAGSYVGNNGRFVRPLRYADEGKVLENYVGLVNKWMGTDYSVAQTEDGKWVLTDNETGNTVETDGSVDDVAEALTNSVEGLENFFGDKGLPDGINNPFSGGIMSLYYFPQNEANHRGFRQYYSNVLSDSTIPSSYIIYDEIRLTTNADGTQELYAKTSDGKTMTAEVDDGDVEGAFKSVFGDDSNVYDFFNDANDIEQHEDGSIILVSKEVPVSPKKHRVFKFENYQNAGYSTDEIGRMDAEAGYDSSVITNIVDGGTKVLENGGTLSFPADIAILRNENRIKSGDDIVFDDDGNIIPLSERIDFGQNELRHSVDSELSSLINQYGAQPQGREPRARDVQVPRQTNDMNRVSQWIRSIIESGKLTDDQAQNVLRMVVEQDYGTYVPTSQAERMEEARAYIAERQPLQAQQEFHDMVMQGKFGVKTNAIGIQLLSDASARGDIASVLDIAADLQLAATEAGQSAQIFNVLKELKGVGSAWYMQKVIDRMNAKYADRIAAGKMNRISVDPALMAELAKATTVDQMAAAEEAVAKDIARQLPLTWDDRLSSWRYFSMLANPTTHIRNIVGNLLMKGLNTAKDTVATGLENILGVDQSDRAHAILSQADKNTWGNWVQQSYEEQARNLSGGSKLGFESFVKQNMRSFDNKFVNALAQFNFKALENEDIAFIKPAYKNALMQYMVAQGYTLNEKGQAGKVDAKGKFREMSKAQMNEAIDWASQQAWKQTFRDASSLATMLNKLSKENAVSRLLVEGVMPFKKTPINIARRGVDYSPAGIIKGIAQLTNGVKKGKVTTARAIDTLASGITGSALMALGVMLAKLGVIRAGGEKDKKLETFLEDTGDQTYAMKFGDKSINMSSIAPATIPLFMGVALNEMIEQGGDSLDLSTITDTIAGTLNPFMEMSFMSSLNSALKNYNANGIGGALGSTIMTAAQNYGSQYLPTLGGKIAQFLDPTRRTTKSDITSPVGSNMDYYARSLAKKVPGLESTLQPDVDIWGRTDTKDSFGDWALDFANKFILPTNIKVTNRDAVDNELIRVVESTGATDFLPSDGNKYFQVNKVKYTMNARQYTQYSQERGQAAYAALKDTMASASYKMASDEQKADMLKKAIDAAYKVVNNQWKEKLGAYDNK